MGQRSRGCLSICSWKHISTHRSRSSSIWMPPTTRCMGTRKGASFTATEPVLGPAKPDPGDCYCYLPLYIFCGRHLLASKLRRADIDAAAGAVEETARIVTQIRTRWPQSLPLACTGARIVLGAASGFA